MLIWLSAMGIVLLPQEKWLNLANRIAEILVKYFTIGSALGDEVHSPTRGGKNDRIALHNG
jgi:hypothetical protein